MLNYSESFEFQTVFCFYKQCRHEISQRSVFQLARIVLTMLILIINQRRDIINKQHKQNDNDNFLGFSDW